MGGYSHAGSYWAWVIIKICVFVLASYVFSLIFWLTHQKVSHHNSGKKKR